MWRGCVSYLCKLLVCLPGFFNADWRPWGSKQLGVIYKETHDHKCRRELLYHKAKRSFLSAWLSFANNSTVTACFRWPWFLLSICQLREDIGTIIAACHLLDNQPNRVGRWWVNRCTLFVILMKPLYLSEKNAIFIFLVWNMYLNYLKYL